MQLIMIHGGNPNTPHLCKRAAWDYGVKFGSTVYHAVSMMDFVEGDFDKYLEQLSLHRPQLALACDWIIRRQRDEYLYRIKAIASIGIIPVVAAKHPEALYIDKLICGVEVRLGISVPTGYMNEGWLPPRQYFDSPRHAKPLHLLGGHPDQWKWLIRYYGESGIEVKSIDGNAHYEQAWRWGKFWSRWGYYREMRSRRYNTNALAICSMKNARRYLENNAPLHSSTRIQECKRQLGLLPKQTLLAI